MRGSRRLFLGTVCAPLFRLRGGEARFTDQLWTAIRDIYSKTLRHPFLSGLTDGTLPRSHFEFYLIQDAQYLVSFSKALSVLASKARREDWGLTLNRHSIEALEEEREMHGKILASYGVKDDAVRSAGMAPVNYAYTNHLLVAVERSSFAEGLAAMLPCYWIYREAGRELVKKGSKNPDYQRWINQYSGDAYDKSVEAVLAMMNAEAARQTPAVLEACLRLFVLSARYEYLFWDMAWREEKWLP